jgi:hypothetical protein
MGTLVGGAQSLYRLLNNFPILEVRHQCQFPGRKHEFAVLRVVLDPSVYRTLAPDEPSLQCPDGHLFDCNLLSNVVQILKVHVVYVLGVFVPAGVDVLHGELEVASAIVDSKTDVFLPVLGNTSRHCVGRNSKFSPLAAFPKSHFCLKRQEQTETNVVELEEPRTEAREGRHNVLQTPPTNILYVRCAFMHGSEEKCKGYCSQSRIKFDNPISVALPSQNRGHDRGEG